MDTRIRGLLNILLRPLDAHIQDARAAALDEPLWEAIYADDVGTVERLISEGADLESRNNNLDNHTPLLWACEFGSTVMALRLIALGADINNSGSYRSTPLMFAAFAGKLYIVQELLRRGADPNGRDSKGESVLAGARRGRNPDTKHYVIRALLDAGAADR